MVPWKPLSLASGLVAVLAITAGFLKQGAHSFGEHGPTPVREPNGLALDATPDGGWRTEDAAAEELIPPVCEVDAFDWRDFSVENFKRNYFRRRPVIIRGVVDEFWPAKACGRWSRRNLVKKLGGVETKVGSGSTGAYLGGRGVRETTFGDYIRGMRNESGAVAGAAGAADFGFDRGLFKDHPRLYGDILSPEYFDFITDKALADGEAWHLVSVGPSLAGFPFHVHGDAWLGVAYGAKHWMLYPPGKFVPAEREAAAGYHPLMSSLDWLQKVLPTLKPKEWPVQCRQRAGEILYIPAYWRHATINVGETVAAGGQLALHVSTMPVEHTAELLRQSPDDPELHVVAALTRAQIYDRLKGQAEEEDDQRRRDAVGAGIDDAGSARKAVGGSAPATGAGVSAAVEGDGTPAWSKPSAEASKGGEAPPPAQLAPQLPPLQERYPDRYPPSPPGDPVFVEPLRHAVWHLERAVALSPGNTGPWWSLADAYRKLGDTAALEGLLKAMAEQLRRDNVPAGVPDWTLAQNQLSLADMLISGERFDAAAAILAAHALPLAPKDPDILAALAHALGGLDRLEEAFATAARALALEPEHGRARWVLKKARGVGGGGGEQGPPSPQAAAEVAAEETALAAVTELAERKPVMIELVEAETPAAAHMDEAEAEADEAEADEAEADEAEAEAMTAEEAAAETSAAADTAETEAAAAETSAAAEDLLPQAEATKPTEGVSGAKAATDAELSGTEEEVDVEAVVAAAAYA